MIDASGLGMKRCGRCGVEKEPELFNQDRNRYDGRHPWCRACTRLYAKTRVKSEAEKQRVRDYQNARAKIPEVRAKALAYERSERGKAAKARAKRKFRFGITGPEFDRMFESQGGLCAVCRLALNTTRHTHLDHCHKTGKIRQILCHNCNRALGAAKDDVSILRGLIDYLERHRS